MYPLKFVSLYFEKIWGGRDLARFDAFLPPGCIGERWDISCHPAGMSIVKNGAYAGYTLAQLIAEKKGELAGSRVSAEVFPLLVKVINSREKLSVQVHPGDDYALRVEKQLGKEEVWYVVDARPGSTLTLGVKGDCTKDQLAAAIAEGRIEEKLNQVAVKKGDVYHIPCGMIHAIGPGVVLLEVQQTSDVTYRLFDYGRDRELHIAKALEVLELHPPAGRRVSARRAKGYLITRYCESSKMILELVEITAGCGCASDPERFHIYICVEGRGEIIYQKGREDIEPLESILIPATLGPYEIRGPVKLLKAYVP